MPSAVDSAWLAPFHAAYTRFETTVSRDDAREFQHTQLKDVWVAVRHAEAQMNARRSLRGLRRIEPFLKGLEQYSSVLGVLCNGTPYLPWLWVGFLHSLAFKGTDFTDWSYTGACQTVHSGELSILVSLLQCYKSPNAITRLINRTQLSIMHSNIDARIL